VACKKKHSLGPQNDLESTKKYANMKTSNINQFIIMFFNLKNKTKPNQNQFTSGNKKHMIRDFFSKNQFIMFLNFDMALEWNFVIFLLRHSFIR
jgi:DNA replication protein DnaD